MSKRALVCGAGGFIGHHLVNFLKEKGYWVRAVDIKNPEFEPTKADEFFLLDLREKENCIKSLESTKKFDEVYQLAADMGGMGYIHTAECDIMLNSALINLYMTDASAKAEVPRYLFSSSACIYPDMDVNDQTITEDEAYPALPDNEYGWEKLYAERLALAYARKYPMKTRIARFQNCYGPLGTWYGGKEKAPAALSRKIAKAKEGGEIEVWGDGSAMRSYTFVSDLVAGIYLLMQSEEDRPCNIGCEKFVSVNHLVETIGKVAEKSFMIKHIDGPVGVSARNHNFDRIKSLGWNAEVSLEDGIKETYNWIRKQVEQQ